MDESTGNGDPGLLAALDELSALAQTPDRLKSVLDSVADPSRIVEVLSPAVLRLAIEVAAPAHFDHLVHRHPALEGRLSVARDFVVRTFPGLALASAIEPASVAASADGVRPDDFTRTLRSVGHANLWFGPREALQPAVRVVLTDIAGTRAFDDVLDWADLLFVANSFLRILADSTKEGVNLVTPAAVEPFLEALPESEKQIATALRDIAERAAELRRSGSRGE